MRVTLTAAEMSILFRQDPATRDDGGFQGFLVSLQERIDRPTGIIDLSEDDLEKIHRYAFDYGNGGWEDRLVRIFGRVLGGELAP